MLCWEKYAYFYLFLKALHLETDKENTGDFMQINLLNNSLSEQQSVLKSLAAQREKLNESNIETIKKSSIDTAAQHLLKKTEIAEVEPVYLTNAMAHKENGLLEEVISLKKERDQKISELVSCGIDPSKAKYIVSSRQGVKGLAVLDKYKTQKADEVIANSTKNAEEQSETSEEIVEEQIEVTKTDPYSGERIKETRVVKKVRINAKSTPATDLDTKSQSVKAVKGQHVNIMV